MGLTERGYAMHGGWVQPGSTCPLPLHLQIDYRSDIPVQGYVTDRSDVTYNQSNQTLLVSGWYYASGLANAWNVNVSVPISDPVVVVFNPSYAQPAVVQTNNWPYSCS